MKYEIILTFLIIVIMNSGPVLDNFPITFQMLGPTTYNPDSGASIKNGYKLRIGYTGHSWLAVQFPDISKNDVLLITASDFYTILNDQYSGHQVLATDYYYTSTGGLQLDQNITNDISSFNYTNQKRYFLTVTRFLGSNGGEDWNAVTKKYSVQKVCFYTAETTFSIKDWRNGISTCYYFEIDNLVSKFVGRSLKSFTINGYQTKIYGWIDGPYLTNNVYIFQQSPLFTYKRQPALILQLGQTSGGFGQDFYVDSPIASQSGDYYGTSVASIKKDSSTGGFQNNGLTANFWNTIPDQQISGYGFTALRIMYSRNISTFDDYDKKLLSTFIFCLHIYSQGSINSQVTDKSCEIVELSYSYVRDTVMKNYSNCLLSGLTVLAVFIGLFL